MILAQGDITLPALADSLRVHPAWLHKVLTGEVTQLTLLTVVGIARRHSWHGIRRPSRVPPRDGRHFSCPESAEGGPICGRVTDSRLH